MAECQNFEQFGLAPNLLSAIKRMGYTKPTAIQCKAIPVVLQGRDVMGAAQTGTGKTASFGLPVLQKLLPLANTSTSPARHPVRVLILSPTRELADQTAEALSNYAADTPIRTGVVSGTTDTAFAPDININREQMAVIMKNYAAKLGYTIPKTLEVVNFADSAGISSWAKEAVKSMQQAGILAGKTNNCFDPAGTATRAEVAAVLRRFVEIVIDPQTANG